MIKIFKKEDISGYAIGNGKTVHIIVDDIYTICTANQKIKKKMLPEDKFKSLNDVTCKKCQRNSLYKNLTFQNKPKQNKNKENKKKEESQNNKPKNKNEEINIWIKYTNTKSYSICTCKNKPTLKENEKTEKIGTVKTIEDFNKITENGKIIGKISKEGLKKRIEEYNQKLNKPQNNNKKEEIENNKQNEEIKKLKNQNNELSKLNQDLNKQSKSLKDENQILIKKTEKLEEEIRNYFDTDTEEESKIKLSIISKCVENINNEFICVLKSNFNFKIIHRHSNQTFFDNIPKEVIINGLIILNNKSFVDEYWNGRHSLPSTFLTKARKAIEYAYFISNIKYPENLKKIAEKYNQKQQETQQNIKRRKTNKIIIKRRKTNKITIKRRPINYIKSIKEKRR